MEKTDQILYMVSSIRKDAYRYIEDELERENIRGLSYTHGAILYALYGHDGVMRLSDIAELINRKKPTVTVLVDKLEKMNFVKKEKSKSDNRVTYVTMTEHGKKLKSLFDKISIQLKSRAFKNISKEKQNLLVDLLSQIEENFSDSEENR